MTAERNALDIQIKALHDEAMGFGELLREEETALLEPASDQLDRISAEKSRRAAALDNRFKTVIESLFPDRHPKAALPSPEDLETQLLARCGEGVRPRWAAVRDTLFKITEMNRRNGQRVMLQNRQVSQALSILQGQDSAMAASVYGADGQTRQSPQGQRHVKV